MNPLRRPIQRAILFFLTMSCGHVFGQNDDVTTLTMHERLGFDRKDEPVNISTVLAGQVAGREDPLRPFAAPKWYCRDTEGYPVYISDTVNHFKNEEIFERRYFTGDHRMADVLEEQRRQHVEYKGADRAGNQPRGPGHQMLALAKFYDHTQDPVFRDRCREVFNYSKGKQVTEKDGKANFQKTEEVKFSKEKDRALSMQNGSYFIYYLSTEAPKPTPQRRTA